MGGRNIDEACSGCAQLLDALQQRNCLADTVTVFTFNHECSVLIETAPVNSVDTHYIQQQLHARVSGGTALFDAIGETVKSCSVTADPTVAVEMLFLTDGEEGSSRHYNQQAVRQALASPPNRNLHITMVSVGSSRGKQTLEALAAGLDHVTVVGHEGAAGNIEKAFTSFASSRIAAQ